MVRPAIVCLLALVLLGAQAPPRGHPGVYRIELLPSPDLREVAGTVHLGRVRSPFGVAVSRDGHHLYELSLELSNLPAPESLGDYSTYVAWVTTPVLRPFIKLGEVREGLNEKVGTVGLNKFVVMVSAEADAGVSERKGRLVLRGMSPSARLLPDAHLMLPPASSDSSSGAHPMGGGLHWTHPPMHPLIAMVPGLEDLRPGVKPFLPRIAEGVSVEEARPRQLVRLADGQTLDLVAGLVRREIHGHRYVTYGFNGQYPGPMIEVEQGSTITVNFENRTELPTSVHWHGVRLDNRYDGVPGVTQDPVPPGGRFRYRIFFKDAGIYWYHPHHREDIQQDLGLYGNMLVRSPSPDYFNRVHREEILMLDDILINEAGLFPYGAEEATHALMGRFGNLLLVNGEPKYRLAVRRGEILRFFLTNVSNTRTFNLSFDGLPVKVVGSDLGKFERESWAETVVIAPAERYIVEVRFPEAGSVPLTNRVQVLDHSFGNFESEVLELGDVQVAEEAVSPLLAFDELRSHPEVSRDIDPYRGEFDRPVDHELLLTLEVDQMPPRIMQRMRADQLYFNPVEWSGTMPMMNWVTKSSQVHWILRDVRTGAENMDIGWSFRLGEVVKLRLVNDREAIHAMQHPIHIHGQRFLILSRNGAPTENLVWKDTMLLTVGETADLLLELSNPGRWMVHCHIAEHLETGMKFVLDVGSGAAR